MFNNKRKNFYLLMLIISLALCFCSSTEKQNEPATVFMKDGSVFKCKAISVDKDYVKIKSRYGSLNLPHDEIEFVEGSGYDENFIRIKEVIKLDSQGNAVRVMPIFVKNRSDKEKIKEYHFLVSGEVVKISGQDGINLSFNQERGGGYSRCTVQFGEYLSPGETKKICVTTQIRSISKQKTKFWEYRSVYVPEKQIFYTQSLTIPEGGDPIKISPDSAEKITEDNTSTIIWRERLRPQQQIVFKVEYQTQVIVQE